MITITRETARSYLVSRQGFLSRSGKEGVCGFIKEMGCVQVDPVNIVDRNQNLVLRNRVKGYRPRLLDELLYDDRRLFEYWCNQRSLLPIEDFPFAWHRMRHPVDFHSPYLEGTKERRKELQREVGHILARIDKEGPLSSADFRKEGAIPERTANRILLMLWDSGELMVHHVEENRRAYDLTSRILPEGVAPGGVTPSEYRRFMLMKYLRAEGLADPREAWRFGWFPMDGPERRRVVDGLVKEGAVLPVRVEGSRATYYILEGEARKLDSEPTLSERALLIAPLDNLIWNRRMVREVFGFDYSWEIYRVPEKRTYGCYTMPILHGTRFIGRLDPRLERAERTLVVNGIFTEPDAGPAPTAPIADALAEFASYLGAERVNVLASTPASLKGRLEHALARTS